MHIKLTKACNMNRLIAVLLFALISSCNQPSSNANTYVLQSQINSINNRIDSLVAASKSNKPEEPIKNTKSKKSKTSLVKEHSLYSDNQSPAVAKSSTSSNSAYSGQCQAITKKGYRCSRKARSNGYCWQHGG
jgi:hypothetical protein